MAGSFIDRNPEEMMRYANEAKSLVGDMTRIVRGIEGVLDAYANDLDDPTREQITKLHDCCNAYLKEQEVYLNIADEIYKKGKRLSEIRSGGY